MTDNVTDISAPAEPAARPRVSRVRAAVIVVAALALAGGLLGALWSVLAPPIHGVVALTRDGDRIRAYLGNESDHFFTAAFMHTGLLSVMALIAAVLLWQWRAHRGPASVAALSVGGVVAAAAAAGVGAALVHLRYGTIDVAGAPVTPDHRLHYVVEAPPVFFGHSPLQIAATLLIPAGVGALTYALMTVAAERDDLGGWPPVQPVQPPPAITAAVVPPSGR
jgi:Protein of unknown function (DUF2567)